MHVQQVGFTVTFMLMRHYLALDSTYSRGVVQFVEALRCKPEGRGFDSRWCHWNFSLT